MRQALYRGKGKKDNKWYYGSYLQLDSFSYCVKVPENTKHYIVFNKHVDWGLPQRHISVEVDPYTICQCIGRIDKNGKAVFRKDIVKVHDVSSYPPDSQKDFEGYVDFSDCSFMISDGACQHYRWQDYEVEVVGNCFNNKELLDRILNNNEENL